MSERFLIPTMDCAAEESEIRRALDPVQGIQSLVFQLGSRKLEISAPPEVIEIALEAIRSAGFSPQSDSKVEAGDAGTPGIANRSGTGKAVLRLVLALVLAGAAEAMAQLGSSGAGVRWAVFALAVLAIGLAGLDTYRKGFSALRHGRLNINALMTVAVTGAFLIGQWPEAAMVMALYAIAEMIEARSVDRARNAIKGLVALAPEQTEVRQGDGTWKTTPAAEVPLDAVIRIRPGERIALDGNVTSGTSAVNQSPVTGEAIPVDKSAGDPVFAGTINETGALEVRVTAAASNTTLARIIHAVEQAQGTKAPTQRFVDRFAAVYTPCVFVLALAVALGGPLLLGWQWSSSIYKALVLLVVACPCALVISTPVTIVSALTSAARRGILIKGGTYLEQARSLKVVALDKTGTVTEGKPRLVDHAAASEAFDRSLVARLASSLASRSDHPVSGAIAADLASDSLPVSDFKALPGRGVQGQVGGQSLVLGNHRLIEELGLCSPQLEARLKAHEENGRTVTLLAASDAVMGIFAVADTIKPSSREAIAELARMGVATCMLTGDNMETARSIAAEAGISEARGNLLPEDKLLAIRELQGRFGLTAMTGDGINDAPALATADIGIAMGGTGTDTAIEAADVVIMNDNLRRIPEMIRLSRKTHAVLWQNISLALGIKVAFLALAIAGHATMWMAVFADTGASLVVVANGLRLLRYKGS